jgi:hypothetical protein
MHMSTLPEVLSAEIHRCRQVSQDCQALGSSGAFASALLEQALRDAEAALRSRDMPRVDDALRRLRNFREVLPEAPVRRTPELPTPSSSGRATWATGARPTKMSPREQFFTWTRVA